jgi:hypothetical protein
MPAPPRSSHATLVLLGFTLLLAGALRVYGLDFGLPYLYQPDEPNKVTAAQNIFKTGDLNPHYFKKPTLLIYANTALYLPYYLAGKAQGRFQTRADIPAPDRPLMGTGYIGAPDAMVMGRGLTVLVGLFAVWLTWAVGRRFYPSPWVPLGAALAVAVSPMQVAQSHYIEVNVYLVAALLGVLWASLRVYERGEHRDYLLAGFLTGIAITCKYPGVVGIVFPLTAHWLRSGRRLPLTRPLKGLVLLVPVGFFLGTPYALLDPVNFFLGAGSEAVHYSTGHDGLEGNAFLWYLQYAWTEEGPLMAIGAVAAFLAIRRRDGKLTLLASFPLVYFVFISLFQVRNGRTFLPLTPFVFLLAVGLLAELAGRLGEIGSRGKRIAAGAALALVLAAGLLVPLSRALAFNRTLVGPDARESSRVWIEANLPAGSRIALESYSPYLSRDRYQLAFLSRAVDQPPDWYAASGLQYLVLSEGMYGRYLRDPARYPEQAAAYQALFARFSEVRRFPDGPWMVSVHAVR